MKASSSTAAVLLLKVHTAGWEGGVVGIFSLVIWRVSAQDYLLTLPILLHLMCILNIGGKYHKLSHSLLQQNVYLYFMNYE